MINKELVEYSWDEATQTAEFIYDSAQGVVQETQHRPLKAEPNLNKYWAELLWFINVVGDPV